MSGMNLTGSRAVFLALALCPAWLGCARLPAEQEASTAAVADDVFFCFWNVENLFDDRRDARLADADREFDAWFADNPAILKQKLTKLGDVLLKMNSGKGPDILAMAEVENVRAAELLRQALNDRIADKELHYSSPVMKDVDGGRHIAPAILTRLPVLRERTRVLGKRQRMLEAHVKLHGHELIVLVTHWTARLRDGSERGRLGYADTLYRAFRQLHARDRTVDLIICGDFNDTPQDDSVTRHLHATGDRDAVREGVNPPPLYNLMADKDPAAGFGTHYFRRWLIFDQIVVSPGMLDDTGWTCVPASVKTVNTLYRKSDRLRRPWRFGSERDGGARGYSDHFPVTVRLKVAR